MSSSCLAHADDKVMWCRHELKYLVSEAQAAAIAAHIRPYMRPDAHSIEGPYPLVSLYLDTDDLRFCRESLDGVKNRFKLRIRSYSDEPDAPRFFEIKRRINQIIVKTRARVSDRDVASLLAGTNRPLWDGSEAYRNLEQFLYYQRRVGAKPVVRVRYLRQALESELGGHVRVTFDRQLCLNVTQTPTVRLNGDGWQRLPEHGVILEIKFTGGCPAWLGRLVHCLGLRRQSISKYAITVRQACGLRFCAPTIMRKDLDGTGVALS